VYESPVVVADDAAARRIARLFPSFRDFVDDALFHPAWGYYSTGKVRFGDGGHYDTFPLALSPVFGRMLARYAHRAWKRAGQPATFEICELGAGNGQLCVDVLVATVTPRRSDADWSTFAQAMRYRIIERSPALIARQRQQLGALAARVTWTRADLATRAPLGLPFGHCGVVFANEVLDCLAHHKVVVGHDGVPRVVFVIPVLSRDAPDAGQLHLAANGLGIERAIPRRELPKVFADDQLRRSLIYHEVLLPVGCVPGLRGFLLRHYPEFFAAGRSFPPYFACPAMARLVRNAARLYAQAEALWIDYGSMRQFHLRTPESRRVFAGPPRSGASVYRAPGLEDITFMVDFSVVAAAARDAGLAVEFYGNQGELARRSGVRLDGRAVELMIRSRTLDWMLAVVGVGPERDWRHTGLTWKKRSRAKLRLRDECRRAVAEFLGERPSKFKLLILRS